MIRPNPKSSRISSRCMRKWKSDFPDDEKHSNLNAILVCSSCGVAGCAGIWSQTCHVSKCMVHWSVRVYDDEFELFLEREAYEKGLIAMLHDMVTSDKVFTAPDGSPYEDKERFIELVNEAFLQRAYYKDMWDECEGTARSGNKVGR